MEDSLPIQREASLPTPATGPSAAKVPTLAPLLEQTARCLAHAGPPLAKGLRDIERLRRRLASDSLHLAVLGQFKRGKSTLLNALIGTEILPTSVIPLTAIPTLLRAGRDSRITIHGEDGEIRTEQCYASGAELRDALSSVVTEEHNPCNRQGISQVTVDLPAPLLGEGVVFIDTPGIGSTHQHNTATTLEFLTRCDAALFVLSADPPITEIELEFLEQVRQKVVRLFFVLNKVDYLDDEQRRESVRFLESVLREKAGVTSEHEVFCVSARDGLRARIEGCTESWRQSGMDRLQSRLVKFLAAEKRRALEQAVASKTRFIITDSLLQLRLAARSYEIPLDDLDERLDRLAVKIKEIQRQQEVAGDLVDSDLRRLGIALADEAARLRHEATEHLKSTVLGILERPGDPRVLAEEARTTMEQSIAPFFEDKLSHIASDFAERLETALRPHHKKTDALVGAVRRAAADSFDLPELSALDERPPVDYKRPYWVTHQWHASASAIPDGLLGRLGSTERRRRRLADRLSRQVDDLAIANVENLRWFLRQRINDEGRRFRTALAERLDHAVSMTRGAIETVRRHRQDHAEVANREITRLRATIDKLEGLEAAIQDVTKSFSE